MNKSNFNRYKKIMLSIMFLIVFAVFSFKVINNIEYIFKGIISFCTIVWNMIVPFAIGAFIAFILNSAATFIEADFSNVFTKGRPSKAIRSISVTIVYLIAVSLISLTVVYLVPAIEESVVEFRNNLPANIEKAETLLSSMGIQTNLNYEEEISKYITQVMTQEGAITSLLSNIANVTSTLINMILGIIISFYILVDKESLGIHTKKIIYSFVEKERADNFFDFCRYVTKTFNKFIVGKVMDSIIIGLLCYIGFLILNIRYRLIFSIIIGVTNIIPYFGPFMGAIPVGILIFLYDPAMTIPALLYIFVLQQFDGSILGPMVLGDAIGVKPVSVIFAILVGGALFGVLGMFLAVPTYVVLSELFTKYIDERYYKNIIEKEGNKGE